MLVLKMELDNVSEVIKLSYKHMSMEFALVKNIVGLFLIKKEDVVEFEFDTFLFERISFS